MSVLQECPQYRLRQKTKNKRCKCGADLDKAKRSRKVRYWVAFRLPDGTQRQESLQNIADVDPYSIEDARAVDSKRQVQRKEKVPIFEMRPESKITFEALADWYLALESVKNLASYKRIEIILNHFNEKFGDRIAGSVGQAELENYQVERLNKIMASTLDTEIITIKTMINKCFENDKVDSKTLKIFRRLKRKAKPGAYNRRRTLALDEYVRLTEAAPAYLKNIFIFLMNTGCRPGEARGLKWPYIDRKEGFIRFPADAVKEGKPKSIPINHHVKNILDTVPRALHCDYVFTHGGEPFRNAKLARWAFESTCKRAGVSFGRKNQDGLTLHDIRRTVKTNLVRAGISDIYRNALLGHAMEGMDKFYVVVTDDDLKQAMDTYTAWLDAETAKVNHSVKHAEAVNA